MTTLKQVMREIRCARSARAMWTDMIYIKVDENLATFFATDGRRFALRTIEMPYSVGEFAAVVRREHMERAAKIVGEPFSIMGFPEPDELLFAFDEQRYTVPIRGRQILSYRHIIGDPVARATVNRKSLMLEAAMGKTMFSLKIAADEIHLSLDGSTNRELRADSNGVGYITVSPRYLRQALEAMPGHREVELAIVDSRMALQIRPAGVNGHLALIQPMT